MNNSENWTSEQLEVLNHGIGNLLVSASAGSGKTKVLIEKIVRLILSGNAKLKDLLVVTFTNSASLEIKQRLAESIKESQSATLLAELDDLSTSDICTFDSFCIKVVREFGYKIGVNGSFSVADQSLSQFLQNEALENILSNHNKNYDENFDNLMDVFYQNRNTKSLKQNIVRIYNFLRSNKDGEQIFKNKLLQTYDENLQNNSAIKYLNDLFKQKCDDFNQQLDNLILANDMLGDAGDQKAGDALVDCKSTLQKVNANIFNCNDISFPTIYSSKKDIAEVAEIKSQYKLQKNNFKAFVDSICGGFKNIPLDKIKNDISFTKSQLTYLFLIVDEFACEYKNIKQAYGILDFADIEQNASLILQDKLVTTALQNRYKYIFIDEYQDTNYLQDNIIQQVTTGDNLIMVGDVKQSIYRFRFTEPKIFLNKYVHYKNCESTNSLVELNKNFRSELGILEFANFVFNKIMKISTDEIDYQNTAQLEYGGKLQNIADLPNVKVVVIDKKKKDKVEEPFKFYSVKDSELSLQEVSDIQREAIFIGKEIGLLHGTEIFDAKQNCLRKIRYSDIAILSRGRKNVIDVTRDIFCKLNIPVTSETNENLFDSFDMQILLAILKVINNKKDDISLLTSLTSIMGKLSFNDVAKIRQHSQNERYFYDAVKQYQKDMNDVISEKITIFYKKLEDYATFSTYMNISELIVKISTAEKLDEYFATNGYGKQYNIHFNLLLQAVESIKNYSLAKFVNYIDTFSGDFVFNQTVKDCDDSVMLSTIHSSKGLEYPVVFLMGTGKKFSSQSLREKILLDNEYGIAKGANNVDERIEYDSPISVAFKKKISIEEKKEEMRLLYVALTRPKNKLIVVGTTDLDGESTINADSEIMDSSNYLHWILGSITAQELETLNILGSFDKNIGKTKVQFEKIDVLKYDFSIDASSNDNIIKSEKIADFGKILDYKFSHNNLAQKNTVTQIMQETDHYNISDFTFSKTDKTGDEDFLTIGTLYHKVMQYINFTFDITEVKNQIDLLLGGKITEEEKMQIDVKKISMAVMQVNKLCEQSQKILKEQQFLCRLPAKELVNTPFDSNVLLQGVADLIIINQKDIYLVDYKTSRLESDKDFAKKYKVQLDLYSNAIETYYQKPVSKKYIYSFYLDKLLLI